ncbi:MAG: alpha/beta hydrolase [Ignavibacteria bacterium]
MKTFKLNGISINDHGGDGKPLIFIHAFPLCSRMWDEQIKYFKDKFRVITYDIRGLGYSNELDSHQFTMEDLVNDFFNIINDFKFEKVNVCGLSVGGYIALRALIREPERFSSVILSDTKSESETNESIINRSEMITGIKNGKRDDILEGLLKNLLSEKGYQMEEVVNFVRTMMSWMDDKGIIGVLMAIATRTNTFYQIKNINTHVLIVAGKEDKLTPPIHSFYMKENFKNSSMKIFPGAGHLLNMELPDEFNNTLEDFLSTIK